MFPDLIVGIVLSSLLGAVVGSQRENKQQKDKVIDFAGFRGFTLVCLLGYIIGYVSFEILKENILFTISFFGIFMMSIIAYSFTAKFEPWKISATSEVSFILTFLIGVMVSLKLYHISISLAILIATILFLGDYFHKFARGLMEAEVFATLKFALIALVILPLLPNKNYNLLNMPILGSFFSRQNIISKDLLAQLDVFNFYHIWLMVVFISGIAYIGYILMKTMGTKKGILYTGVLGGFMSSTALTSTFAIESRRIKYLSSPLAVGTVIACSTMFFRIIFEIAVLNPSLLVKVSILLGVMGFFGFFCAIYLFKKIRLDHVKDFELKSPFAIGPALKFAFLFLVTLFVSKLFSIYYGDGGIYTVAFLSGMADVDAITISLSNLSMSGNISENAAALGILIAAFANTIFKGGIAYYLGSRKYFKDILIIFSIILLSGLFACSFLVF